MNKDIFLMLEKKNREIVKVSMQYVDMTEDLISGIVLSQIVYWFLPNKNGDKKTRIEREEKEWIAKKRTDWWKECRVSTKQVDSALSRLKNLDLIETKVWKFNGNPTTHITIKWKHFLSRYSNRLQFDFSDEPNYENPELSEDLEIRYYPNGNNQLTQKGITSITETTTERDTPTSSGESFSVFWNLYHTVPKDLGKIKNEPARDNLLPLCRKWTPQLEKIYKQRIKEGYTREDMEKAVKIYCNDIFGRNPEQDYSRHRFSILEFLKQGNAMINFINR